MKRIDFLRRLGIGVAAAVIAPKVLAEIIVPEKVIEIKPITKIPDGWMHQIEKAKNGNDYIFYGDREQINKFDHTLKNYLAGSHNSQKYQQHWDDYTQSAMNERQKLLFNKYKTFNNLMYGTRKQ